MASMNRKTAIRKARIGEGRFDKLRFKVYSRFCDNCPRIFKTKSKNASVCVKCSPRSSEIKK